MSNFTEMDCYLFGQATHYDIYRKMGAHKMTIEGEEGVCFDVWAPHADRVYVIGEFNGWNETCDTGDDGRIRTVCTGRPDWLYVQVPDYRAGWKKAVQSRPLCKLCTAPSGDRFHCHGYFELYMVGFRMDGYKKETFQRRSI